MQIDKKGLLLGLYSSTGNLVSLVVFRWVDSHNITYFRAVYREFNFFIMWSIFSSLIILFSILYFCSSRRFRGNSKRLGIVVFGVVMVVFFASIPMNFTSFSFYVKEAGVEVYPPAYPIMFGTFLAAISGLLAGTSFIDVGTWSEQEQELFLKGLNKMFGSLVTAVVFLVVSGGILSMLSSLTDLRQTYVPKTYGPWLVMFPFLTFYLSGGIIVWLIEVYAKIRTTQRELS